jgi:type IV pilus assembly protein PilV
MNRLSQCAPPTRTQRGVALIECMMALLIFSVGLLGLLGLEARVMNFSSESENRNRAAMFASELASQMWLNGTVTPGTADYTTLKGTIADQSKGGLPGGVANATVTVTPLAGTTNTADIVITWLEHTDAPANLSTLTTRVVLP